MVQTTALAMVSAFWLVNQELISQEQDDGRWMAYFDVKTIFVEIFYFTGQ